MSLKYGKAHVQRMIDVLEGEHETVGGAAEAALLAAERIFEERASYVVVGQLVSTKERLEIPPSDPEAIRLALGWYSTEGDARSAAESLWHSGSTGDTFRTWVLPVHHGTPADLHGQRKKQYEAQQAKAQEKQRERLVASIEKHQQAAEERAKAGAKGRCATCDHQKYDHLTDGSGKGACGLTDCPCGRWKER